MIARRGSVVLIALILVVATTAPGCSRGAKHEEGSKPPSAAQPHGDGGAANAAPTQKAASASPDHADESQEHAELPTKVRLPEKVVREAGIKTAPVELASLPATVDLTGEIAADPDKSARLAARVAGRIIEVRFKEGDRVKAGQVVAVLESPELARARATLTAAVARARSARLNAARLKSLEAKALAAGQEVATADAEASALEAEVEAARQTLTAFGPNAEEASGGRARLTVRTPVSGFVLTRDGVQGQTVDAEHVIALVGDLDRAYFLARLFEKDLAKIEVGASAEVRLNAYPNEAFAAKVETIGRQLDPAARTVTARILVHNKADRLKVGLFGTARVVIGAAASRTRRVVVPVAAVTDVAGKTVAFVLQPDGDFELHPVTTGRSAGGRVEILTGLRAGEAVVVDGVFTLKSAILKSTFGEDE
jgi:membrane fusion protein, heavy metal efflux system